MMAATSEILAVTVSVTHQNEAPIVTGNTEVSYPEAGTGVVGTYRATDDDGASVTWSLSGTDRGDFSISANGVLTFRNPPNFEAPADANRNNEYLVTVRANDGAITRRDGGKSHRYRRERIAVFPG